MSFNLASLLAQVQQQQQSAQSEPWYADYQQAYNQFIPNGAYDEFKNAVNQIAAKYPDSDIALLGDTAGKAIAQGQAAADKGDFFDNLSLQTNPLKYGDALGLTRGPLSGRVPGKLTDQGINLQQIANPGVPRSTLETANDVAPYVAGAIATFGGSAAATPVEGAAAPSAAAGTAAGAPSLFPLSLTAPEVAVPAMGSADLGAIGAAAGATGVAGAGATGAATTGAAAGAGGSVLSRVINGSGTTGDYANLLGTLGAAGIGAYGSNEQANRLREIYNDMATKRQPFLDKSLQYLNDPASYAAGPGAANLDAVLRRLSVGGNPVSDPTKLDLATKAGLSDWRNAVTSFGNLGLSGEDTRANVATNAASAANNVYGDIGYGIGAVTAPRRKTLGDYLGGLV